MYLNAKLYYIYFVFGKINGQNVDILYMKGCEAISYTYQFEVKFCASVSLEPYIGDEIIVDKYWHGLIIWFKFLETDPRGKYYYECKFCSKFEYVTDCIKLDIHKENPILKILRSAQIDYQWLLPELKPMQLIQYEETDANVINYLSYTEGFMYFIDQNVLIFSRAPSSVIYKMQMSRTFLTNENMINQWTVEIAKQTKIGRVYGFNIDRPNDKIYAQMDNGSAEYWRDAIDSQAVSQRLSGQMSHSIRYKAKTINPHLRVGHRIELLDKVYYIIAIVHEYNDTYSNECILMQEDQVYQSKKIILNHPILQIATVIESRNTCIKVQFQWSEIAVDALLLSSVAGKDYGSVATPHPGERVLIGFNGNMPFVFGAFYDSLCAPNLSYSFTMRHDIDMTQVRIPAASNGMEIETSGHFACYSDILKLQTKKANFEINNNECIINVTKDIKYSIKIMNQNTQMTMEDSSVMINAKTLTIEAEKINLNATDIVLNATQIAFICAKMAINSSMECIVKAPAMQFWTC